MLQIQMNINFQKEALNHCQFLRVIKFNKFQEKMILVIIKQIYNAKVLQILDPNKIISYTNQLYSQESKYKWLTIIKISLMCKEQGY